MKDGDTDIQDLLRGDAALLDAAKKGCLARVQKLCSPDNINCRDTQGRNSTPLHLAGNSTGDGVIPAQAWFVLESLQTGLNLPDLCGYVQPTLQKRLNSVWSLSVFNQFFFLTSTRLKWLWPVYVCAAIHSGSVVLVKVDLWGCWLSAEPRTRHQTRLGSVVSQGGQHHTVQRHESEPLQPFSHHCF